MDRAVGFLLGIDAKQPVPVQDIVWVLLIAIPLMAFPIFSLQKAIVNASSLTIGAVSSTGPLLVFLLQGIEGRVEYASYTLLGLLIYFVGSITVLAKNIMKRPMKVQN